MAQVLKEVLKEAASRAQHAQKALAVFDLDSTLFDLTPRHSTIISKFANDPEVQKRYPKETRQLQQVKVEKTDWGLKEILARVGIHKETSPSFFRELTEHWNFFFFSNHHLHEDLPMPGAARFVNSLLELGTDIMYLTGRDRHRMLDGTRRSLAAHGFALEQAKVQLLLKPDPCQRDSEFKLQVLENASQTYSIIWVFENEPVNINLIRARLPEVKHVLLDTTHSRREEISDDLIRIQDFLISEN